MLDGGEVGGLLGGGVVGGCVGVREGVGDRVRVGEGEGFGVDRWVAVGEGVKVATGAWSLLVALT